ncbi:MAG: hypothetical protein WDN01_00025 [Rhizomicrobium sp.]
MYRSYLLATAAAVALVSTSSLANADAIETVTVTAQKLNDARIGIQPQIGASTRC